MKEFIKIFDVNDLSPSIWSSLIYRLQLPILIKEKTIITRKHEYRKKKFLVEIESKENEFDGILNYLQKNFNIKDEIGITYSSKCGGDPFNLLQYNNTSNYFATGNIPNSWICFRGLLVAQAIINQKHGFWRDQKMVKIGEFLMNKRITVHSGEQAKFNYFLFQKKKIIKNHLNI